jgi:hypothetical protein
MEVSGEVLLELSDADLSDDLGVLRCVPHHASLSNGAIHRVRLMRQGAAAGSATGRPSPMRCGSCGCSQMVQTSAMCRIYTCFKM